MMSYLLLLVKKINEVLLSLRLKPLVEYSLIEKKVRGCDIYYLSTPFGEEVKAFLNKIGSLIENTGCYMPDQCKCKKCSNCPNLLG